MSRRNRREVRRCSVFDLVDDVLALLFDHLVLLVALVVEVLNPHIDELFRNRRLSFPLLELGFDFCSVNRVQLLEINAQTQAGFFGAGRVDQVLHVARVFLGEVDI